MPKYFDITPDIEFPKLISLLSTCDKLPSSMPIEKDSAEWTEVEQLLNKSVNNARILAIDLNMNKNQWKLFSLERKMLSERLGGKAP